MKKSLNLLVSIIFIAILTLTLCACDGTKPLDENNCDTSHDLKQLSYTAPTCKTNGQQVLKCSKCEYTETKTLLPIEHDYIEKSKTPSTCSQHGTQLLECSMCHTQTNIELPLLNHNYELISETPSTCAIKGVKNYKCNDCDDVYIEELELLRHQYTTINTATCFSNGNMKNICDNCQHEEVLEETSILSHEFDSDGYCTKCGIYKTLFDIDELNTQISIYQNIKFTGIRGNLTTKFNNKNIVPDSYWQSHIVTMTISLFDENDEFLENCSFKSTTYNSDFGATLNETGKLTLQAGGFGVGFSNQFKLHFPNYGFFKEDNLLKTMSFKLEIICDGYEKIEKVYNITQNN